MTLLQSSTTDTLEVRTPRRAPDTSGLVSTDLVRVYLNTIGKTALLTAEQDGTGLPLPGMPVRAAMVRDDMVLRCSNRFRGRYRLSSASFEPAEGGPADLLRHLGRPIGAVVVTDYRGVMVDDLRAIGFLPHLKQAFDTKLKSSPEWSYAHNPTGGTSKGWALEALKAPGITVELWDQISMADARALGAATADAMIEYFAR